MRRPPPCSYFIAFFRIMSFLWGGSAHTLGQAAAARCSCLLAYHPQSSKPLPVFTIHAIQFCPFGQKRICWSGPALDKSDSMVPTEATPSTESPRKGASTPLAPTVVPVGTVCSPAAAQTPSASQHSETVTVAFEAAAIPAEATASPAGAAGSSTSLQSVPDSHTAAAVSSPLTSTKKILKKLCEYSGCTVQPSFNFPGERGGSHCAAHRLKGQIK